MDYALLSAACITFGAGEKPADVELRWSRWHLYMGDRRKDDGSLCVDEPRKTWKPRWDHLKPPAGIVKVTTFAHPLTDIVNSEALKAKVVRPLLDVLRNEALLTRDEQA